MAEISLREYLAKLDTLLKSSNAPEVILHCRHILQHFPKEAQTYRILGRALVDVARWPEAGEVMRRVLSVFPDDRYAHAGLSQVYRAEKRPDDAIWHLERAYEQAPNDQEILDDLRELYRKYRKIEHGKVQLTAGAVARSYIRNGLHEQAVDTLQQALASTPERIDLKLLLAQTYWDAGKRVEAAEIALQVLKVLPDCLVANSLLAALWLTEERPSDAQRYIDRIQSLDPYLALDLAQGQDVPDDAFKLEELDYQRAAEREVLVNAPDWLQGMTHPDANAGIIENPDKIVAAEGLRRAEETPEWSEEDSDSDSHVPGGKSLFGLRGKSEVNPSPTGSLSETGSIRPVPGARRGLTGRLNPPQEQITPEAEDIPSFMADLINTSQEEAPAEVEVDQPAAAELPDWLQASIGADESLDDELPFAAKPPTGSTEEDPLAWLRGSGVEIVEGVPTRPNDSDLFDAEDDHLGLQAADEVDPLAWLRDTGGDTLIVEDESDEEPVESSAPRYFDEEPDDDPEGDPLAWLNAPPAEPVPTEGHGLTSFDEADEDSLSWLADDSLLDEALNLESLVNNEEPSTPLEVSPTAYEPDWQETMADEKDPLDWLSSSDSEPEEEFTWADEEKSPPQLPSEEDFPDWLGDPNQDAVSDDNIDWMSALPEEPEAAAPSTGNTGMLEWLNKAPVSASEPLDVPATPDFPDWLNELETEARPDTSAEASLGDGGFEWLSAADEVSPGATSSEVPDWLTGSGLTELPEEEAEPEPVSADMPDWLSEAAPVVDDEPEAEAEPASPDWLAAMNIDEPQPEAQSSASDDFSWMSTEAGAQDESEPVSADMPDWLSEAAPVAEAEPEAEVSSPDWLSAMSFDEPQSEPEPAVDAPDWLSEAAPVAEDEPQQDAVITDEPDWLTEAAPVAEVEPEAEVSSPDWLSAMSFDEPQSEPEPAVDAPDWLSEAAPVAEDEPQQDAVITDEPDWLRDLEAPAQAQPEPTLEAGVPEWLSEEPELTEPPEADTVTAIPDQIRNWAATVRSEASMTPQLDDDTPDWLAAMQPEPEPEDDYALASDEPDWLAAADTSIESAAPITEPEWSTEVEQPTAVTEEPDWLTSEQPTAESEFDDEQLAAADSPDWLAAAQLDLEPESTPAAVVSDDTPDWLRDVQPEAEAEPELEPVADSAPDWLSSLEPDAEPAQADASLSDEPDWLRDVQPEAEAEPELEPIADSAPDWLSSLEPDAEPAQADASLSNEPDWLRDVQPEAEAEPELEPVADSAPDWLSSLEPLDEADEPEPAAADEPDWITDIVPADTEEEPYTTSEWLSDPELDAPPPQPDRSFAPPGNFGATRDLSDYTGGSAHDDDRDWLPKTDDDLISRVTSDAPQWLDEVQMDAVPEPDQSYSEFSETDENGDMPDWIQAMKPAPAEPEYAEPEISIEDALPGTPAPAENAPDWLNAMVPGLDVDYDAPEDEQIEKDFIAGHENRITPGSKASTAESRPRPEFSWLTDIVDEESQQIRTVGERSRRRFVFSRLPAWLRQPTEKRDQPQSGDETNDVDIPPWLK